MRKLLLFLAMFMLCASCAYSETLLDVEVFKDKETEDIIQITTEKQDLGDNVIKSKEQMSYNDLTTKISELEKSIIAYQTELAFWQSVKAEADLEKAK